MPLAILMEAIRVALKPRICRLLGSPACIFGRLSMWEESAVVISLLGGTTKHGPTLTS